MRRLPLTQLLLATLPLPLLAQVSTQSPPLVPISSFAKADQYYNPLMSPDGKHLAVTVRVQVGPRTVPMVSFFSLPEMKLESTVRMKLFEVPADYVWVSNRRLLVQKGIEVGSREKPQLTGELLAMDFDGTRQDYLFGWDIAAYGARGARYGRDDGYAYPVYVYKEGNDHLLVGTFQWDLDQSALYDFDTRSGVRKLVTNLKSPSATFVMDNNGKPRFATGSDDEGYSITWRFNGANAAWDLVKHGKEGTYLSPFAFSADNAKAYARYAEDGGKTKLISEDMATGERKVLAEDALGDMGTVLNSLPSSAPFGVFSLVGRPRITYLDQANPDTALHQDLARQFPDHTVSLISQTTDRNKIMFGVLSDSDPGAYYLYDRKTNKADMLFASMDEIEPEHMAKRRPISYTARDGSNIDGYLTMPPFKTAQKPPLILLPHGGPYGIRDGWYFDADAQFLANRGYAVLQVNFRGSGGRGFDFRNSGYRQWGGKIIDDLVDGVKWAAAQGEVDGSRMCVYGVSFGAYSALMLASREPALFKCAVGYAGVYDIALMQTEEGVSGNSRRIAWNKRVFGEDKAEWARYSPHLHADTIKAGVLLIHGGKDKTAPKEHVFLMKEALEKAGHPPEWYYVDYEGHGFYDTENQAEVYRRLEAFFAKYLGKPR